MSLVLLVMIHQQSLSLSFLHTRNSALMAVDIRDEYIGIALGYHRRSRQSTQTREEDFDTDAKTNAITSINPLPPLPYMSRDPHHPSYSFHYRHRPVRPVAGTPSKPHRIERTMEVALQLAQLSTQRSVKSILVRWPGGGAALGLGGDLRIDSEDWANGVDDDLIAGLRMTLGHKVSFYGTLGYQRGKILYVLDKCCGAFGHNSSSSLLMEGSRPFALWDTSDDCEWITLSSRLDPSQQCEVPHSSKTKDRLDKYGNSIAEMDQWGRAPIFGMPPDYRNHTHSKQAKPTGSSSFSEPHFDQFHDAETKIDQLKGSFAAMLTLRDFANTHLEGKVALPSWVKLHEESSANVAESDASLQIDSEVHVGYRKEQEVRPSKKSSIKSDPVPQLSEESASQKKETQSKLATLVQMPRKGRRGRKIEHKASKE